MHLHLPSTVYVFLSPFVSLFIVCFLHPHLTKHYLTGCGVGKKTDIPLKLPGKMTSNKKNAAQNNILHVYVLFFKNVYVAFLSRWIWRFHQCVSLVLIVDFFL
ncbi:hypothetical protein ACJX0J_008507, partial [Zea mays]